MLATIFWIMRHLRVEMSTGYGALEVSNQCIVELEVWWLAHHFEVEYNKCWLMPSRLFAHVHIIIHFDTTPLFLEAMGYCRNNGATITPSSLPSPIFCCILYVWEERLLMIDLRKPNFSFMIFSLLLHKIPQHIMVGTFSIRRLLVRRVNKNRMESSDTNYELQPNMARRCLAYVIGKCHPNLWTTIVF